MVMVGSDGSLQFYRKRNPTWQENAVWRRSETPGPGIFETPWGRIGGVICFDSFSLETFEGFKQSAVDLVIIVACWGTPQPTTWRPDTTLSRYILHRWSSIASEDVPHQYATQLKVPVVFVNQGGLTHTPLPMPRFWTLPPLSDFQFDFCGRSSVQDASGKILAQADKAAVEFNAVIPVDIQPAEVPSDIARVDIPPRYLKSGYYFVQPPFLGKIFQAWSFNGFKKEYNALRNYTEA